MESRKPTCDSRKLGGHFKGSFIINEKPSANRNALITVYAISNTRQISDYGLTCEYYVKVIYICMMVIGVLGYSLCIRKVIRIDPLVLERRIVLEIIIFFTDAC